MNSTNTTDTTTSSSSGLGPEAEFAIVFMCIFIPISVCTLYRMLKKKIRYSPVLPLYETTLSAPSLVVPQDFPRRNRVLPLSSIGLCVTRPPQIAVYVISPEGTFSLGVRKDEDNL